MRGAAGSILVAATTVFACMGALPLTAGASTWNGPTQKGRTATRDLSKSKARGPIEDRILTRPRAYASSHQPNRVDEYVDEHGHRIRVGTSIEGLDLGQFASILASTVHSEEMDFLQTLVVGPSEIAAQCGAAPDAGVVACYAAEDPARSFAGEMIIPSTSPDLVHAVVHEYGHHMDNSLLNLAHLGICDFSNDGSRRWFFARDADDDLFGRSGCSVQVSYGRLLGELFAEDFVALHGIDEWWTSEFPPPTRRMLNALSDDIRNPFRPVRYRYRGRVSQRRRLKIRRFRLAAPTFFSATLRGPGGRRNDLDLFLWRRDGRRPLRKSVRLGSREYVERVLAAGSYEVGVAAYRGRGSFRLVVDLD